MRVRVLSIACMLLFALSPGCWPQTTPMPTALPTQPAPPPGTIQTPAPPDTSQGTKLQKSLKEQFDRHTSTVRTWSRQANEEIGLSFAIGLLGLLVGALQSSQRSWTKILTVASGFAISVMTLCTHTFFPADYRTLKISVSKANSILAQLDLALVHFDPSQSLDNQRAAESDFLDKCAKIDLIEQDLLGKGLTSASLKPNGMLFDTPVVYAQNISAAPAWVRQTPAESAFKYFVGQADDPSLMQAKNMSYASVVDQAAHWLRGDQHQQATPEPTRQLLDLVERSANVADTWYSYDNSKRVYSYFTLLRIPINFQNVDVKGLDPEIQLGSGLGPFHFGMTSQDVNSLLPHPFGSVASLPVAGEFKTAEVRYFWVPTAQFPSPSAPKSPFPALQAFQACWQSRNSYVTFLFAHDRLIRISARFFWDCPDRLTASHAFADSYSIAGVVGGGNTAFRRVLSHATVQISISPDGTAVDVFENGSPI